MTEETYEELALCQAEDERLGLQVIEQITRAFAGVVRGDGMSLHQAALIDQYVYDETALAEARRLDTDERWQDVPASDIEQHDSIFCFLDARAFRYYAPAYMVWAIRQGIPADTFELQSQQFIVYAFDSSLVPEMESWFQAQWSLFTLEQCRVIGEFLRYMHRVFPDIGADSALASHWWQFDDSKIDLPGDVWLRHRISHQDHIDALVAQITGAFDGVERGRGVSLHEADVIDGHGSAAERAEARRLDTDTRWQDVPEADIERCDWILSFLDAEGFRYYAPAYMVWSLRYIWIRDSDSIDSLIYSFDLGGYADQWALFSQEQCRAICGFLRFMAYESDGRADNVAAQAALKGYWEQFGTR